jgi:hypothetical protein
LNINGDGHIATKMKMGLDIDEDFETRILGHGDMETWRHGNM